MPPKKKNAKKKKPAGGGGKAAAAGDAAAAAPEAAAVVVGADAAADAPPDDAAYRPDDGYDDGMYGMGGLTSQPDPPPGLNQFMRLDSERGRRYPVKQHPTKYVEFVQYRSEADLPLIVAMMVKDLSEPYPIFTYRYFINNWPDLAWLCLLRDENDPAFELMIGAVTCKASFKSKTNFTVRGYIAMLAVNSDFRGNGFGSRLVELAVETMQLKGCVEVVLEAELSNKAALGLYEGLGFVREKRLDKYYLDGSDAFRLKLWLEGSHTPSAMQVGMQ